MKIRIGILEDEHIFVEKLQDTICAWAKERDCLVEISDYQTSESFLPAFENGGKFDIVFLDIMLPSGLNGMAVAERMRETDKDVVIIFLTSNVDYMADGYDVSALQYLLKPLRPPRLKRYLNKALDILENRQSKYYVYKNKGASTRLSYKDILYFTSCGQHIEIHTKYETYSEWTRLKTIESTLPSTFVRCHRAYIVNIEAVSSIHPQIISLVNRETIPMSDSYVKQLKDKWMYYYG